jgi:hypothetical protein
MMLHDFMAQSFELEHDFNLEIIPSRSFQGKLAILMA